MAGQLLSAHGCGRATAYPQENKIVTLDDRVHVAWLDSVADGFRVRIRTLDRGSGTWSETHTIGEAYDNHGGPSLVCDSQGYLHVAYYPHHHAIRYRRSLRPNDASAWTDEELIGDGYSYPKLAVGRDDELLLSCRNSFLTRERRLGHEKPWDLHLLRKSPGGSWSEPLVLASSRHPNYAHFGESYAWAPDRVGLHMAIRFHEKIGRRGVRQDSDRRLPLQPRRRPDLAALGRDAGDPARDGRDRRRDRRRRTGLRERPAGRRVGGGPGRHAVAGPQRVVRRRGHQHRVHARG